MPSNIYQPRPSTIALNAGSGDRGMDSAIYVNTNESLQVTITSSIGANVPPGSGLTGVSVNIDVRMLTVNNGLQYLTYTFIPDNQYSTDTYQIKLPEGFLLNISAYTTGTVSYTFAGVPTDPLLGQTWVNLSIVAPVNPNQTMATYLTQGYVTNEERIAYPPQQIVSYPDGYPFFRWGAILPGRGPGYAIPQNAVDEITGITFQVTTTGTPGSRLVYLAIESSLGTPTTRRNLIVPMGAQGPSLSNQIYTAFQGAAVQTAEPIGACAPLPQRLRMKTGEFIYGALSSPDGSDVLGGVFVWGNEWLVP